MMWSTADAEASKVGAGLANGNFRVTLEPASGAPGTNRATPQSGGNASGIRALWIAAGLEIVGVVWMYYLLQIDY